MPLRSTIFAGDARLEAAAVSDANHIAQGARGPHVAKIQQALNRVGPSKVDADGQFGPRTAAAVLAYKQDRGIINRAYQTAPDAIVGRMTIAALDADLVKTDGPPGNSGRCVLDCSCSRFGQVPARNKVMAFAGGKAGSESGGVLALGSDDRQIAQTALADSRRSIMVAIGKITNLQHAMARSRLPFGPPIPAAENAVLGSCNTWLNTNGDTLKTMAVLASAVSLMRRNLAIKTSKGGEVDMKRVDKSFHAAVNGNTDDGIELGVPFFTVDGPLCRRDVITHEFFHFLNVHHGGGALDGPTIRSKIVTTAQALDSADNLAQLISELSTADGSTDSCAIAFK